MKILVLHGPNLGLLGSREPGIYGHLTLEEINQRIQNTASALGVEIECRQSDIEGELVQWIGQAGKEKDGLVINPAAYTHTSVAIRDAISASGLKTVEVHLSNTHAREPFRHNSLTAPVCLAQIQGFGPAGYQLALQGLVDVLRSTAS
ncbi:MAG: type II 3-dehydroquinate dehydratase [Kiritimatiellia bacterium]